MSRNEKNFKTAQKSASGLLEPGILRPRRVCMQAEIEFETNPENTDFARTIQSIFSTQMFR